MDFVSELVRKRAKENLHKFIQFIVEIFKRYILNVAFNIDKLWWFTDIG